MPRVNQPSLADIRSAARRINGLVTETPLRISRELSTIVGGTVGLKLETLQPTGAFKIRGAANAIRHQRERVQLSGVVTASTGNHGIAVSYVANRLGLPAIVCVSDSVSGDRVATIEGMGAAVVRAGTNQAAAIDYAQGLARDRDFLMVPPFDHPDVISGAGTIALEILEQSPQTQAVLVPVSGGGLAAGVGLAIKNIDPTVRVIGIGAERAPAMRDSLRAGRPVAVDERPTVAASLMGDLGNANQYTFDLVRRHIDKMILVAEQDIVEAMSWTLRNERLIVEGAAAVTIAYLLQSPHDHAEQSVTAVITGDNVDANRLRRASEALTSATMEGP